MSIRILSRFIGVVGLTTLFIGSAEAQFTLTGTNYTQNFNTVSSGLPPGWSVGTNANATSLGSSAPFPTASKTWGDTTGEFGNCASTVSNSGTNFNGQESTTIQGNCTNRALAIRQGTTFPSSDPGAAFVFQINNTTGLSNLTFHVDLNMLGVQLRSTVWTIAYAVGNAPASFTTLGTYSDPGVFGTTTQTYNLGADASNQSKNVWLRVVALDVSTGSDKRDTFGIDNFSLSWTTNSLAAVLPLIASIIISGGNAQIDFAAGAGDIPSSFLLFSSGQVNGSYTDAAATITSPGPGLFHAACAVNGPRQFYYVKRQ